MSGIALVQRIRVAFQQFQQFQQFQHFPPFHRAAAAQSIRTCNLVFELLFVGFLLLYLIFELLLLALIVQLCPTLY